MCGIAGIVERMGTSVSPTALRAMNDTLTHRGPDAAGIHIDRNVGIAHRRLSIIDVTDDANQPLFNEDGTVAVVFNGEIYNFRELREQLEHKGHVFRTSTDSEVLVHGWEEYGTQLPEKLLGMFAFAVYDAHQKLLFAARDRLGQKPFFYHSTQSRFVIGSEIKAVRAAGSVGTEINPQSIVDYMAYGYILGELTVFKDVHRLPPAHWLLLKTDSASLRPQIQRYWDLQFEPDYGPDENEWIERLDEAADRAVQQRLVSDVPLGTFLSGGVDSSLVTAYAARHRPGIKTFSIGFHEQAFDESSQAQTVAAHLNTDHHCEYVTPSALEVLPQLIECYDEPFADSSAIPTWYLSRMTKQHVTVALSGDGGDELHSGYTRYGRALEVAPWFRLLTPLGRYTLHQAACWSPRGGRLQYLFEGMSRSDFSLYDFALGRHPRHMSLLNPELLESTATTISKHAVDYQRCASSPFATRLQYVDVKNYLPEDILVKVDRASMAHSLEVRCPLLDHRFVELSVRIPPELNRRGRNGKRLLKRLAQRYVPSEVIYRPKMGFGVPLESWLRNELKSLVYEVLADAGSLTWEYFDITQAERQFAMHLAMKRNCQSSLWRLLFFDMWAKSQVDRG